MAQTDYFLKIDGIDGESSDQSHKGEIVLSSWNFGASLSTGPMGSGGGSGKVSMQSMHLTKPYDKSSIALFVACCSGQRIRTAKLSCRKDGAPSFDFLTIALTDLVVASYNADGSDDASGVRDLITLSFGRIVCTYIGQAANGQPLPPITGGWDVIANRKI